MNNLAKVISNGELRTKSNGKRYVWVTIEKDGKQGSAMYTVSKADGTDKTLPKVGETVTIFNEGGNLSIKRSHVEIKDFAAENAEFAGLFSASVVEETSPGQKS